MYIYHRNPNLYDKYMYVIIDFWYGSMVVQVMHLHPHGKEPMLWMLLLWRMVTYHV